MHFKNKKFLEKFIIFIFFLIIAFLVGYKIFVTLYEDLTKNNAGVVLTFDDRNIDDWYSARTIFKRYGVKSTFCIFHFDKLTDDEINKLKILKEEGHEIACHGLNHLNATEFCKSNTIKEYIETEIVPAINIMEEKGFKPRSFAYPHGANTIKIDAELLNYFKVLRDTVIRRKIGKLPENYCFNFKERKRVFPSVCIDSHRCYSAERIENVLQYALNNGYVIIFFGHRISREPGKLTTTYSTLKRICDFVVKNNMKFYRLSELYRE